MARPNKQGIDYFPLDVQLDEKFRFVEIKYKLEGFAIIIKLLQYIYLNGSYCKWSKDELLLFAYDIKADASLVEDIIRECLKREIFNSELYEKYQILTSEDIQEKYKKVCRKQKSQVNNNYRQNLSR